MSESVEAFGPRARTWAAGMRPVALPVIVADLEHALEALPLAVRYRTAGTPFALAMSCDDELTRFSKARVQGLLGGVADFDRRAALLDSLAAGTLALGERPAIAFGQIAEDDWRFAAALFGMADIVLMRSRAEYERLCSMLVCRPWASRSIETFDVRVPAAIERASEAEAIVVWAPDLRFSEVTLPLFALRSLRREVAVICADPASAGGVEGVYGLADAAPVLAWAAAIVDANTSEPSSAMALARLGIPLATCAASGAHERLSNVATYNFWDARSIFGAVVEALAALPPYLRPDRYPVEPVVAENLDAARPREGPLVSLLIATRNRRDWLERALESAAAQTYESIEVIVINDAGEPVDDLVARFPKARVLNRSENGGRAQAYNDGIADARGVYIGMLDDDDVLFPDHLAGLVGAAERSGASVAHSSTIIAYMKPGDGPTGYRIRAFGTGSWSSIDRDQAQVTSPFVGALNQLIRRDALAEVGPLRPEVNNADDYELVIRLADRFEFVHVDRATAMYSLRDDGTNASVSIGADFPRLHRLIYRMHARPERPAIEQRRTESIQWLQRNGGLTYTKPSKSLDAPVRLDTLLP